MKYIIKDKELKKIFRQAECNISAVRESESCLCLFCGKSFHASEVDLAGLEPVDSAICPYCGYDAILPSASGLSLTDSQLNEARRIAAGGIKTVCNRLSISRGGITVELLLPVNADLDTLAHSVIAIFGIPLGEPYDFTDNARRYFFKLPTRRSDKHETTFGVRLHHMDLGQEFKMWCLGDMPIALLGEVETGKRYALPHLISVIGDGLTLTEASERLRRGYIKTRNFYWTYTPEA